MKGISSALLPEGMVMGLLGPVEASRSGWRSWEVEAKVGGEKLAPLSKSPLVEIRRAPQTSKLISVLHIHCGEESDERLTFHTSEMGPLLADWRLFLNNVRKNIHLIVVKDFYNWLLGDKMAQSKSFKDTRGYEIGPLKLYKKSFSKGFQIEIGWYTWPGTIEQFDEWLRKVEELHKPYLKQDRPKQDHE